MKKLIAAAMIVAAFGAQAQMMHFLVADWYESGNHLCKYDNGTVLNVGFRICPLSI